jgi:hypothetical protein
MPRLDPIIGLPRHYETEAEASDRRSNQDDRERDNDAQNGGLPARRRPGAKMSLGRWT